MYFAGVQNLRLKVWRVHVILVELTTLPKKPKWPTGSSLSPKPSALVAGWLGSDTKLDYADTNSPDRS